MVTRGPGATNAAHGVHIARQDSTPMILLIGQVARGMRGREAFQEIDYRAMFGSLAKWVYEIDDPARIPEMISRAFHTAVSGRAGPGGDRAARGHADRAGGLRRCGELPRRGGAPGARRHGEPAEIARRGASARSWSWAAAAGAPRRAPTSRRSPRASTCRSACRSGARTISTTPMPTTPAMSASRWRRL